MIILVFSEDGISLITSQIGVIGEKYIRISSRVLWNVMKQPSPGESPAYLCYPMYSIVSAGVIVI